MSRLVIVAGASAAGKSTLIDEIGAGHHGDRFSGAALHEYQHTRADRHGIAYGDDAKLAVVLDHPAIEVLMIVPTFPTLRAQMAGRVAKWKGTDRLDKVVKWSRRLADYDDEASLLATYRGFYRFCAGRASIVSVLGYVERGAARMIVPLASEDDVERYMRGLP